MYRWQIHIRYQNIDLDCEQSKVYTMVPAFVSTDPIKV